MALRVIRLHESAYVLLKYFATIVGRPMTEVAALAINHYVQTYVKEKGEGDEGCGQEAGHEDAQCAGPVGPAHEDQAVGVQQGDDDAPVHRADSQEGA